jgi:hypothetical protein
MKNFTKIIIIALSVTLFSCSKTDKNFLPTATEGGFTTVQKKLVNYFLGIDPQLLEGKLTIYQGDVLTKKILVYKQYFTKDTTLTHDSTGTTVFNTNVALLNSYDITQTETGNYNFTFNLTDLVSNLILNGSAMPTTDNSLIVGSYWKLTYKAITNQGDTVSLSESTTVSIATRFAGTYKVVYSEYYRINTFRPDVAWPETYDIQSLDATTYRVVGYAGPFAPTSTSDNNVDFTVSPSGQISYLPGQIFNDFPIITCATDPSLMTNVRCGNAGTNTAVADFITGKDKIIMACGYNTTSGAVGPREWYVELEKIP